MPASTAPETPRASSPSVDDAAAQLCPICLAHIEDERSKAIVLDCLHVFCVPCISRWSKLRRECPLCKGFFKAYIHDIISATSFKECCLSPLRPQDSKNGTEDTIQALLRDAREQYTSWQASQPRHSTGSHQRRHRRGHHGGAGDTSSNPERRGLTEPRPYYFRLQRNLAARAGLDAYGQPSLSAAPADETLDWRRSVYTRNVWALPVRVAGSGGAPPPNAAAPAGEQRLQDWVARELLALLHQEDVLIVKGLVLSLVRSHGLVLPPDCGSNISASSSTGQRHVSPADALRPFLHEHAEHFWHELRNFACAPFTIITYDRTVRYGSREQATGSGDILQSATAPASERRRSSRWDVQRVRASMSRRRQSLEAAPPLARLAVQQQPAQPSAGTAEAADRHDDQDNSSNAASQSAELLALRSRAMQSVGASSSREQSGSQRRHGRSRKASMSPDGQHRQMQRGRQRMSTLPAEPHHRKRHDRRHTRVQAGEVEAGQSAAFEPAAGAVGEAGNDRWVMD